MDQPKTKVIFPTVAQMPPMAVSLYDMSYNKTGSWRNVRPVIHYDQCSFCMLCWKYCPEPAITLEAVVVKEKERAKPVIHYDYCKGCGICWTECPSEAIEVVGEEK